MKKNMNRNSSEYFDTLASALSTISGVITWTGNENTEDSSKAANTKSTDKYFDFLADTLSISRVVA